MQNRNYGLKIFSPEQVARLDQFTVQHEPIASLELMERAALTFTVEFVKIYKTNRPVAVFCGLGNNGGDGLAIARLLISKKYKVKVFVLRYDRNSSKEFKVNHHRLETLAEIEYISYSIDFPKLDTDTVIVDAILGSGLNRPITGFVEEVIDMVNKSACEIVSVDIASGLFSFQPNPEQSIVQPKYTLSFQLPKLSFLLPQNHFYTGEFVLLPIGLSSEFMEQEPSNFVYLQLQNIGVLLKARSKFAHKGHFGHVLMYAGSKGKMGACLLASEAAMRSGCGLLSVLVEESQMPIVQSSIWEAMCIPYQSEDLQVRLKEKTNYTLCIGPGIGLSESSVQIVEYLLGLSSTPVLIDADGLNLLALNPHLLLKMPRYSILTPHPKEFERLVGNWGNDYERLEKQRDFSSKYEVFIVLKGANTSISTPDGHVFFNSTGNPGMATAGSGDVLSGIITSLLAQHYIPEHAVVIGVFLHGLAGDLAVKELGEYSLVARDIIRKIPAAFQLLTKNG